ncbi:VPA1267 family protein [Cupriavidus necator]|uniref:VPA1267 family protein n=1 Tax=Cupriavidus necator TaxID=106590 RepID=UPI00339D9D4E
MNGQERAEENFKVFLTWASTRSDSDFHELASQGRLNRGEICRECNFSRSVLTQNPRVKAALLQLEERLRATGVLSQVVEPGTALPLRAKGQLQAASDAERLKRLEAENSAMRVELADLRQRLKRYEAREALLAETGRLAR